MSKQAVIRIAAVRTVEAAAAPARLRADGPRTPGGASARRPAFRLGRREVGARAVTAGLLTVTVVWNLSGFAAGFFEGAWGTAAIPVTELSYALNAAIVLSLPFSARSTRRTVLTQTALGALMAAWSAGGVVFTGPGVALGPLPGILGAGVPMVLGMLVAGSGYRLRVPPDAAPLGAADAAARGGRRGRRVRWPPRWDPPRRG